MGRIEKNKKYKRGQDSIESRGMELGIMGSRRMESTLDWRMNRHIHSINKFPDMNAFNRKQFDIQRAKQTCHGIAVDRGVQCRTAGQE